MYSIYDGETCGYVQGMNFLAGMLVYHSCPSIAFAAFVKMIETYELQENYLPGLPGLHDKCEVIDDMIETHLPDVHAFLHGREPST